MIIEIEEREIENLKEDLQDYVNLIKKYDEVVKVKNHVIKNCEENLEKSKEIMIYLTELLLTKDLSDKEFDIIDDVKSELESISFK